MQSRQLVPWKWRGAAVASVATLVAQLVAPAFVAAEGHRQTRTPIQHLIVIIGENRTFDHVFATYKPRHGESVSNLLSKGIVKEDGTPGRNFSLASQSSATDSTPEKYRLSPSGNTAYAVLPPVLAGGGPAPFPDVNTAKSIENGLPDDYLVYLTTGNLPSGLSHGDVDTRIPNAASLPSGPFQLTSSTHPYDVYDNSPVHRFYQMWQQFDCSAKRANKSNPSGCKADLFPWVETTIGAGSNGNPQAANFSDTSTKEGSTSMGFYNMLQGDAPYLKYLADHYAMSDNYHQAVMGGTGANHIMLGFADDIWYSANGKPAVPPHNELLAAGSPNAGVVDEIENPNPAPGTNNWYTEDGYGNGSYGSPSSGGGTYSNCSDSDAAGVSAVVSYLRAMKVKPNCDRGHYYILNNYNPGYFGDGSSATSAAAFADPGETVFTIPGSPVRSIGDALSEKGVSWAYYGDQWNAYLANPDLNYVAANNTYCNICNPFQYSTSIMTSSAGRAHNLDTADLYAGIQSGNLPAVSYVKPDGYLDGHPASSKLILFEGFVKKIVDGVQANQKLWANTAIVVTFDEGGGYYDSGYIQPLDFFGDGTRIPAIVVSPFSKGGHISHTYADHVSVVKFIEANWGLKPLTNRSRDNYPNPVTSKSNPYVPLNGPALGDLMDLFNFDN
jgi:phospholipase C